MIKIVDPDKFIREQKLVGPVTSSQYTMGKTSSVHPDGLFSEQIFGIEGSPERARTFSWINLHCNVIHPMIYDILYKRIEKKIESLLSGEKLYKLDEYGLLTVDDNGDIDGMSKLFEQRYNWRFSPGEEESDRSKIVSMLEKNIKNNTFFMNKLLVIPPDFRPMTVMDTNEIRIDELNDLYKRIIILSTQLESVSGTFYDVLTYKMQILMKDLQDYIRLKTAKKQGIIRRQMLGKRVDFSGRTVITPNPKLKLGEVGLPLRIACQIFEPHILFGLVNSNYAKNIPEEFHLEVKKFLGKEQLLDMGY